MRHLLKTVKVSTVHGLSYMIIMSTATCYNSVITLPALEVLIKWRGGGWAVEEDEEPSPLVSS